MKLQGDYAFAAPRTLVWRALLDPDILARTLPGCEKLERTAENEFRGVLNIAVGPVKGQFEGTLQLTDLRPLEGYHMKLNGKGPNGFMTGEGDLRLSDAADGGTTLGYDIDSQVGGRVAGVGQRLLESSAKSITRQGLEGLARELAAMKTTIDAAADSAAVSAAAAIPVAVPPPSRPTQAEVAARVASDVARDLVPPEKRLWIFIGIGAAILAAAFLLARSCGG
jgi:carbon monoxide dehydrogenase subunit G